MKIIIFLLLMTSTAFANPCADDKQKFERAKKFGASNFKCTSNYDGSAVSSFSINSENYKKYVAAELERSKKRITRENKGTFMPLIKKGNCPIYNKRLKLKKANIIPIHKHNKNICLGSNKSGKNNKLEFKEAK